MANDLVEFAEDVAYQFGYYCQNKGRLHITHGGLSTLEWAFDILGWENPHPVPECECEIDGCHEHATCGTPTKDGYKPTLKNEMEANMKDGLYTAHEVAVILEDAFGDDCACNFNGNDEWLPYLCELQDACPHPCGVACWEQYLKYRHCKNEMEEKEDG